MSASGLKTTAIGLMICAIVGGATTAPTTPTTPTTQRAAFTEKLNREGAAALKGADPKAARDAFDDAMRVDPSNVSAAQGLSVAYLQLSVPLRALKILQALVTRHAKDRSVVINYAAACVMAKQPMPGVKALKTFMQTTPADQDAADAMAIALNAADEHARQSQLYEDGNAFLQSYLAKLAVQHPGERYWDARWIPADEAARKSAAVTAAQTHVNTIRKEIVIAQKQIVVMQNQVNATEHTGHTLENLDKQKGSLAKAQDELAAKQKDLQAAVASVQKSEIPDQIPVQLAAMDVAATPVVVATSAQPMLVDPAPQAMQSPTHTGRIAIAPQTPAPLPPDTSPRPAEQPQAPVEVTRHAACFAVAPDLVVTAAEIVANAAEIRIESPDGTDVFSAAVESQDADSGLALLRVTGRPLPYLPIATTFKGGAVMCIGFPEVNLFSSTAGTIPGLIVSPGVVSLSRHPRLAGAPLFAGGQVIGVELASREQEANAIPFATLDQLQHLVGSRAGADQPVKDFGACIMTVIAVRGGR